MGVAHPAGVVDTNVVILLPRLEAASLPERLVISTVTLAELSVGPALATTPETVELRRLHLEAARQIDALPFDQAAADAFGRVAAALHERGRKVEARRYDALIAATALSRRLPLYTVNAADFVGIAGLDVVAVPHPGPSGPSRVDSGR